MHPTSFKLMEKLVETYAQGVGSVLDIGSMDVNGSYKPLFSPACKYVGLDLVGGANVDVVVASPYHWPEVASGSFDLVISGQAFEHIKFFWLTLAEIHRVLKPRGLCFIIAPSSGPVHSYPVDCWRFYEDGMRAMAEYVDMEILEVGTQNLCVWKNSYLAGRKKHED